MQTAAAAAGAAALGEFIGIKLSYEFGATKQRLIGGSKQRLQHELTKGMILLGGTQSCADMLPAAGNFAVQQHFDERAYCRQAELPLLHPDNHLAVWPLACGPGCSLVIVEAVSANQAKLTAMISGPLQVMFQSASVKDS